MSLTCYLIESPDHPSDEETVKSLWGICDLIIPHENRNFDNVEPETDHYMFLYTAEVISEDLREAIPIFLKHDFDVFVLYKMHIIDGETRLFTAPRIFKRGVKLIPDAIRPLTDTDLKVEKILNGWIKENGE